MQVKIPVSPQYTLTLLQDIEIGRVAHAGLQDLSSAMPWNIGTSVRGSHQGSSVSRSRAFHFTGFPKSGPGRLSYFGLDPNVPSRRVSRLTSASPLVGRGRSSGFERYSSLEIAQSEDEEALLGGDASGDQRAVAGLDLPGPSVNDESQMASESQQTIEELGRESLNFLDYVRSRIEAGQPARDEGDIDLPMESATGNFIAFHDLLQPPEDTKIVATQAFYHILALVTRNLVTVEQSTPFGDIRLTLVTVS